MFQSGVEGLFKIIWGLIVCRWYGDDGWVSVSLHRPYMAECIGNVHDSTIYHKLRTFKLFTLIVLVNKSGNIYLIWTKNNQYPIYWFTCKYARSVISTHVRSHHHIRWRNILTPTLNKHLCIHVWTKEVLQ